MKNSKVKALLAAVMSLAIIGSTSLFASAATTAEDWDEDAPFADGTLSLTNGDTATYQTPITGAFDISFDVTFADTNESTLVFKLRTPTNPENMIFGRIKGVNNASLVETQFMDEGNWGQEVIASPDRSWVQEVGQEVTVSLTRAADADVAHLLVTKKGDATKKVIDADLNFAAMDAEGFFDSTNPDDEEYPYTGLEFSFQDEGAQPIEVSNISISSDWEAPVVVTTTTAGAATTTAGAATTTAAGTTAAGTTAAATTAKNPGTGSALPLSVAGLTVVAAAALFVFGSRKSK